MMSRKGKLIIISGPSGAGKTSVVELATQGRSDISFSTSVTTRAPRPGETDGKDYFFITRQRFDDMVRQNELLEHAEYINQCYGTPRAWVEEQLASGIHVILDIEIQGARQVSALMPEAIKIFIIPPSLSELEVRLHRRGTETEDIIKDRLKRARQEYLEADFYDYIIVNDKLNIAASEFQAILTAENCRMADRDYYLKEERLL